MKMRVLKYVEVYQSCRTSLTMFHLLPSCELSTTKDSSHYHLVPQTMCEQQLHSFGLLRPFFVPPLIDEIEAQFQLRSIIIIFDTLDELCNLCLTDCHPKHGTLARKLSLPFPSLGCSQNSH